jgi:hypothetical protein
MGISHQLQLNLDGDTKCLFIMQYNIKLKLDTGVCCKFPLLFSLPSFSKVTLLLILSPSTACAAYIVHGNRPTSKSLY